MSSLILSFNASLSLKAPEGQSLPPGAIADELRFCFFPDLCSLRRQTWTNFSNCFQQKWKHLRLCRWVSLLLFHEILSLCLLRASGIDYCISPRDSLAPLFSTSYRPQPPLLFFFVSVSYDWSKGYSFAGPQQPNQIFLHPTKDEEVKKRPKK